MAANGQARTMSDHWLDLEEPIRDLKYMAGIARDLSWKLLDGETLKDPDRDVTITMSLRQYEQLLFAILRSHDMAMDLDRLYLGE